MDNYNHISEEQIAAFIEGNLNAAESIEVINAMTNNENIVNIVSEANLFDEIDAIALYDGDFGYLELGIDPIYSTEELLGNAASIFTSNILMSIDELSDTVDYEKDITGTNPDNDENILANTFDDSDEPSNDVVNQHTDTVQEVQINNEYNNSCCDCHIPIDNVDSDYDGIEEYN